MSEFSDNFTDYALADHMAQFGESVTYYQSGVSSSITADFDEQMPDPEYQSDGQYIRRTATLKLDPADITTPAYGDKVTARGVDWSVESALVDEDGMHILKIVRSDVTEKSKRDMRINRFD